MQKNIGFGFENSGFASAWRGVLSVKMSFFLGLALFIGPVSAVPPTIVSVTPANGSTAVPLNSDLIFVFDQDMDTTTPVFPSFPPFLVGNIEFTPSNIGNHFAFEWGNDERTLIGRNQSNLPGDASITWKLNPPGAFEPISNVGGEPLATVSGGFTTASSTGGGTGCDPDGVPDSWGFYSIYKFFSYEQTSSADPVPPGGTGSPRGFGATVRGPAAGPEASSGSITLPDNSQRQMQNIGGTLFYSDLPPTDAALESSYPPGTYTVRFTQTGQPERVIPMTMSATPAVIPKISNFAAAQSVNPAQDFTLQWNPFTGATASDYLSIFVSDSRGNMVFQAPDPCVPRDLPVNATSVVIPANTLKTNETYTAMLSFGRTFYYSTNAVSNMAGSGGISRTTEFTIKTGTGGGGTTPAAARFTGFRLLPNGHPELTLTGTASRSYTVQRSGNVASASWSTAGTVTMNASGQTVFEDTASVTFPAFYRAVAN